MKGGEGVGFWIRQILEACVEVGSLLHKRGDAARRAWKVNKLKKKVERLRGEMREITNQRLAGVAQSAVVWLDELLKIVDSAVGKEAEDCAQKQVKKVYTAIRKCKDDYDDCVKKRRRNCDIILIKCLDDATDTLTE